MRSRKIGVAIALVLGLALLTAANAQAANQAPGATYTGTFWGKWDPAQTPAYTDPISGTLEFDVSADGSQVTRFAVTSVEARFAFGGGGCTPMSATHATPVAISPFSGSDTQFRQENGNLTFDGIFYAPNEASGRLQVIENQNGTNCYTGGSVEGNIFWTASANGGCTTSQEYAAAQAKVEGAKAAATGAKAVHEKTSAALRKANAKRAVASKKFKAAEGDAAKEAKKALAKAKKKVEKAERSNARAETQLREAGKAVRAAEDELARTCREI